MQLLRDGISGEGVAEYLSEVEQERMEFGDAGAVTTGSARELGTEHLLQALLRLLLAEPRPAYEKISAALAMPIGSIGPTRARALARLRRELDREGMLALVAA